MYAITEAKQ